MKYYFSDNRSYGADDLKAALGVLVAAGGITVNLSDSESYDPSKLNGLIGSAVAAGVVPENNASLKLIKSGDGYSVMPGRAVFSDGGIAVLDASAPVDAKPGQYVYLAYSAALDDVYFIAEDTEQTEHGGVLLVPLGRVKPDGSVENRRVYARGRVPALASANWTNLRTVELSVDVSSLGANGGYVEATHEIDGDMNFMLVDDHTLISVMHTGAETAYHTVMRSTSRDTSNNRDYLGITQTVNGTVRATLISHGNGYIRMRYYVPGPVKTKTLTYTALIGITA